MTELFKKPVAITLDPKTGDYILQLPPEVENKLQWEAGDTLQIETVADFTENDEVTSLLIRNITKNPLQEDA